MQMSTADGRPLSNHGRCVRDDTGSVLAQRTIVRKMALIIAVSGMAVLFDMSLATYRDTNLKDEAWRKVSAIVGVPGTLTLSAKMCRQMNSL